jgi:hypothetical protein
MELRGYLDSSMENELNTRLTNIGLVSDTGVTTDYITEFTTTTIVKQGADVRLNVKAQYTYSKLSFLVRANKTENFVYDRTMVRRTIKN